MNDISVKQFNQMKRVIHTIAPWISASLEEAVCDKYRVAAEELLILDQELSHPIVEYVTRVSEVPDIWKCPSCTGNKLDFDLDKGVRCVMDGCFLAGIYYSPLGYPQNAEIDASKHRS